jgi:hypothetical protein
MAIELNHASISRSTGTNQQKRQILIACYAAEAIQIALSVTFTLSLLNTIALPPIYA